jgi:hypothetical protein
LRIENGVRIGRFKYDEVGHFFTGRVRAHAIDFVR